MHDIYSLPDMTPITKSYAVYFVTLDRIVLKFTYNQRLIQLSISVLHYDTRIRSNQKEK